MDKKFSQIKINSYLWSPIYKVTDCTNRVKVYIQELRIFVFLDFTTCFLFLTWRLKTLLDEWVQSYSSFLFSWFSRNSSLVFAIFSSLKNVLLVIKHFYLPMTMIEKSRNCVIGKKIVIYLIYVIISYSSVSFRWQSPVTN